MNSLNECEVCAANKSRIFRKLVIDTVLFVMGLAVIVLLLASCGTRAVTHTIERCREDEFRLNSGPCATVDDVPNVAIANAAAAMGPHCPVGRVMVNTDHDELVGFCS